jgi:hypothetical protein
MPLRSPLDLFQTKIRHGLAALERPNGLSIISIPGGRPVNPGLLRAGQCRECTDGQGDVPSSSPSAIGHLNHLRGGQEDLWGRPVPIPEYKGRAF